MLQYAKTYRESLRISGQSPTTIREHAVTFQKNINHSGNITEYLGKMTELPEEIMVLFGIVLMPEVVVPDCFVTVRKNSKVARKRNQNIRFSFVSNFQGRTWTGIFLCTPCFSIEICWPRKFHGASGPCCRTSRVSLWTYLKNSGTSWQDPRIFREYFKTFQEGRTTFWKVPEFTGKFQNIPRQFQHFLGRSQISVECLKRLRKVLEHPEKIAWVHGWVPKLPVMIQELPGRASGLHRMDIKLPYTIIESCVGPSFSQKSLQASVQVADSFGKEPYFLRREAQ